MRPAGPRLHVALSDAAGGGAITASRPKCLRVSSANARATGSVLFGLDTLALLIGPPDAGIRGPVTAVTRILAGIVWVIGLSAVVFLWQKDSSTFFKTPRWR